MVSTYDLARKGEVARQQPLPPGDCRPSTGQSTRQIQDNLQDNLHDNPKSIQILTTERMRGSEAN